MTAENTNFKISNSDASKIKLSDRERKLRETTDQYISARLSTTLKLKLKIKQLKI